jgi:hypothetical protein
VCSVAQVSQAVTSDFPDLQLSTGLEIIAGLLYVPLSSGGRDFIAFLRKGQPREVHWAGRPFGDGEEGKASLEPRTSFRMWSEITTGKCRAWTDEQLETAGVLALVYGKVWFWVFCCGSVVDFGVFFCSLLKFGGRRRVRCVGRSLRICCCRMLVMKVGEDFGLMFVID